MDDPAKASWGGSISNADFSKLKAGFEAPDMDYKWEIKADDPDENGIIHIHISRSWTQTDLYILVIKPNDSGGELVGIIWEQDIGDGDYRVGEELAKRDAIIVCRMVVKCELETFPLYDRRLLWQPLE